MVRILKGADSDRRIKQLKKQGYEVKKVKDEHGNEIILKRKKPTKKPKKPKKKNQRKK